MIEGVDLCLLLINESSTHTSSGKKYIPSQARKRKSTDKNRQSNETGSDKEMVMVKRGLFLEIGLISW